MSNANDAFISRDSSLLTLKGEVSVHFLDGSVIEGEFATQDAFNIFLTVEGEPMMIPRAQIRYLKGRQGQQIEEDTSQEAFLNASPTQTPEPETDRHITEEYVVEGFADEDDDDDDGTVVLGPADQIFMDDDDDDDDDDGTVILSAGISEIMDEDEDEDDGTVILTASAALESEFDPDDATVMVSEGEERTGGSASLLCIGGPHTGQTFSLEGETTTIGRSSDNGVVLSGDKEISRHHAIISRRADKFVVQDNDSLNGTFVNDERVSAPRPLENNDVVVVGISALKYQEE